MPTENKKKKQPEDYLLLAANRGFRWLGPEVRTTKTLTTWECPKGHQWRAIYNNIQQGRDCPFCARKKTAVDYQILAQKRNFQWLGPFVTNYILPTKWKCELGHEWLASYREILRGDCCPRCSDPSGNEDRFISGEISKENEITDDRQIVDTLLDAEIISNPSCYRRKLRLAARTNKPTFSSNPWAVTE